MRVLKFGGTSVSGADQMLRVARYVSVRAQSERVLVVTSAMADVTDQLVEAISKAERGDESWRLLLRLIEQRHFECLEAVSGEQLDAQAARGVRRSLRELAFGLEEITQSRRTPEILGDRLLAQGETMAVHLLAAAFPETSIRPHVEGCLSPIQTDSQWGRAAVDLGATGRRARKYLSRWSCDVVPIIPGFVGQDGKGRTTTLGRGGSDLSATVIGAAFGACAVEIWTDVDGVRSAPPSLVADAVPLTRLGYDEAAELAFLGASVLHPDTLAPASAAGIPVVVRNTFNPAGESTVIGAGVEHDSPLAISALDPVVLLEAQPAPVSPSIRGDFLSELHGDAVMVIAGSVDDRQVVAVRPDETDRSSALLESAGFTVHLRHDLSLVSVVGHGVARQPEIAGIAYRELARQSVEVHAMTTGACHHSLRFLVDRSKTRQVVQAFYDALVGYRVSGCIPISA